jgi:drug/metabolite transporter (DMT)-like permease
MFKLESTRIILGYILICVIWGSTWLAIKIGLESIPPFLGAAIRFFIAASIMSVIVRIKKINIPRDRVSVRLYILAGTCTFSLGYAFVYWGQQYVPSALASILFGTFPFFVAALSWFIYKSEYLTFLKAVGIIIGFIGVVIIFSEDVTYHLGEASLLGMLAIIIAAVIQAFASVTIKNYGSELSTFALVTVGMSLGTVILFVISFATEDWSKTVIDGKAIGSVLYLSTFGSIVTFGTMFWLLKRMEAVILSLSAFITPLVAILLGIFIAGEEFTVQIFAGSGLVLLGILVANLRGLLVMRKRKKAAASVE